MTPLSGDVPEHALLAAAVDVLWVVPRRACRASAVPLDWTADLLRLHTHCRSTR